MAGTYAKDGDSRQRDSAWHGRSANARNEGSPNPNFADNLTFKIGDYPFLTGVPDDIAMVALFLASDESANDYGSDNHG